MNLNEYSWYTFQCDELDEYDKMEEAKSIIKIHDISIDIEFMILLLVNLDFAYQTTKKNNFLDKRIHDGTKVYSSQYDELLRFVKENEPHHHLDNLKFKFKNGTNLKIDSFQLLETITILLRNIDKDDVNNTNVKFQSHIMQFSLAFIRDIKRFLEDFSNHKSESLMNITNSQCRVIASIYESIGFDFTKNKSTDEKYIRTIYKRACKAAQNQ